MEERQKYKNEQGLVYLGEERREDIPMGSESKRGILALPPAMHCTEPQNITALKGLCSKRERKARKSRGWVFW